MSRSDDGINVIASFDVEHFTYDVSIKTKRTTLKISFLIFDFTFVTLKNQKKEDEEMKRNLIRRPDHRLFFTDETIERHRET